MLNGGRGRREQVAWTVGLVLSLTFVGKDSSLFQREEKRDVSVELTKTDNEPVDDYSEFPAGCIARSKYERNSMNTRQPKLSSYVVDLFKKCTPRTTCGTLAKLENPI